MLTHIGIKSFAIGSVLLTCGLAATGAQAAQQRWYCSVVGYTNSFTGEDEDPAYGVAWGQYSEDAACDKAGDLVYDHYSLDPDFDHYYSGWYWSNDWIDVALDCTYPYDVYEVFSGYGDEAFSAAADYQGGVRSDCFYHIVEPQ